MVKTEILHAFFRAWYDYRTDPDEDGMQEAYHKAQDMVVQELKKQGVNVSNVELRQVLSSSFGDWQKKEGLPKPGKK